MQSRFIFLLAYRYLWGSTSNTTTRTMIIITWGSIFVGTFLLTLTLAIMHGFQQATIKTLQGIHANIIISLPEATSENEYNQLQKKNNIN